MTHPYYDPTVMAAFKDWTTAIQYLQPNMEEPVGDELEDAQEEQPVPTEENMRVHGALTQALAKLDGVTAGTEEFQFAVEDAVTALDVLRTDPAALSAGDDFMAQLGEVLEMLEKYRNIQWGFVTDDAEKDPAEPMLDTMADSAGYLMSMHIEPDRASRRRAERRIRVLTAAAGPLPKVARWRGVLGYEGQFTGDGRSIQPNALRWETPLPLRYVGVDNGGHDGAQVVGTVETIERREGGVIWGTGIFDLGSPHGQEAFRVVDSKIQRGVSLDLDDVSFEVRAAPKEQAVEQELAEDGSKTLMTVKPTDEQTITTDARVRAATVVAIPAFATAFIETYTDEENVEGMAEADTFAVEEVYGVQVPERIIDRVLATLNFAELASIAYLPIDDEYPDDDSSEDSQEFKRKNWVEQTGGLPRFIKRISKHLRKKGMTESHAIATAVNVVKKMCFVPGTLVRTEFGYRPIEDVVVGDRVLTHTGRFQPVTAVMVRDYDAPLVRLRTPNGVLRVTPEHPFLRSLTAREVTAERQHRSYRAGAGAGRTERVRRGPVEEWSLAAQLDPGDVLRVGTPVQVRDLTSVSIPTEQRVHAPRPVYGKSVATQTPYRGDSMFELTPEFLWALGLFIAEGSTSPSGAIWTLHFDETEYAERLRALFTGLNYPVRYQEYPERRMRNVIVGSRMLARWLADQCGKGSHNKHVPDALTLLPVEKMSHLVQGVMDGDGSGDILGQTSSRLAQEMAEFARRKNLHPTLSVSTPENKRTIYTLSEVQYAHARRGEKRGYFGNDVRVLGTELEDYTGPVYNLSVAEDESYVVEGLVTHNCASGDTNFPGKQNVNAKSRAAACKAVAEWEAKKAAARAKKAGATDTFATKLRTDVKDIDKELDALEKSSAKDVQEAEGLLAELDKVDADIAAIELGEPQANAKKEAAPAEEEPPATPAKLRVRFATEHKEEDHPRDILGRWTDKETAAATNRGAQDALISQGLLDKAGSDGIIGPKTVAAVKAWQKANGLPVTGRLDAGQLSLLKSQPGIDRVSARGKRAIAKAKVAVERAEKQLEKVKASAEKSRARLKEQQAKAQEAVDEVKARQAAIQQDIQEAKAALLSAEREYGVGSQQAMKAQKAVDGALNRYDESEEALQASLERAEDFVVKFEDLEFSLADRIWSAQDSLDDKKQNVLDVTEKSEEDVAAAKEQAAERAERAREKAKRDAERAAAKAARDKERAARKSQTAARKSTTTKTTTKKVEGKSGRAPTTRRAPVAPPPLPRTTTSSPRPKVAVAARTRTFRFNPTQLRWPKGVRQGGQWMDTPWKIGTDFLDWWDDFDDKSGAKSRLGVEHVDGPNGLRRAVSDLEDLDSPDILYNTQNLQDMVNNLWTDGEAAGLDGEFFDKMQETYDKLNDISYLSQTEWDNLVEANHEADVPTDEVEAPRIPDHILADFKGGSAEKYIQNGRFTPEREKLHREIIGSFLAGVTKPEGTPEFRMMGGGPAAGKSRMTQLHPELEENSVLVNADEVKALLPEYNELISAGEAGKAARFVHEESSYVTKLLTAEAIGRGFNILLDGTGDSSLAKLRGKIADARASGYVVDGYYVTVDTEIAVQRSNARALKTGRHVPESIIRNTHQSVSAILPQAMDDFDSLVLVDNGGGEAVKVMEKVPGGTPEILDPELWEKFLRKAD